MKRMFLVLCAVVGATACGGDTTDPTPVTASGWTGEVTYTRNIALAGFSDVITMRGNVDWVRDSVRADLVPLTPGAVAYVIRAGSMTLTRSGGPPPCSYQGAATSNLIPSDGYLVVGPDGAYSGHLRTDLPFTTLVSCPPNPARPGIDGLMHVDLPLVGVVANSRIQGAMPERVISSITWNGTWNLFMVL